MIYRRAPADLVGVAVAQFARGRVRSGDLASEHALLERALRAGDPQVVFQPIVDLTTGAVTSYEALARFPHLPDLPVDEVFHLAHRVGRGHDLEVAAVAAAVRQAAGRPAGTLLSVNASPSTIASGVLIDVLPRDLAGLQVEITEHEEIDDLDDFLDAIATLRVRGARIAIDDVGEGYAGLQRVMLLRPDLLKVDRALVSAVHREPALAALLGAITRFAASTGAEVCAEGIEEPEQLSVLADLDVAFGQGWFLGRPSPGFAEASEESRRVCQRAMDRAVTVGDHLDTADLVPVLLRVSAATSLDALARVLRGIAPAVGATHVELSYLDDTQSYVEAVTDSAAHFKGVRYYLDDFPLTRRVLADDVAAQVVLDAPGSDLREAVWMREDGVGSLLMVPVSAGGRVVGLFECHHDARRPWRRRQIRAARAVAAVAGPVLENLLSVEPPSRAQPPSRRPHGEP